jgi:hypothetical protein
MIETVDAGVELEFELGGAERLEKVNLWVFHITIGIIKEENKSLLITNQEKIEISH